MGGWEENILHTVEKRGSDAKQARFLGKPWFALWLPSHVMLQGKALPPWEGGVAIHPGQPWGVHGQGHTLHILQWQLIIAGVPRSEATIGHACGARGH